MEVKEISMEEALEICSRQEGHFFDRKALGIKPAKIQKIACAFANADGGEFILGIADDRDEADPKLRWKGSPNVEAFNNVIQALTEITPSLDIKYSFLSCREMEGIILSVIIEKSSQVHYTSDKTVYQRISAQSLPLDPTKVVDLTFAKGMTSFEDQVIPGAQPEDITESEEIKKFLLDVSPKTDPLEYVVKENLVDRKSWDPKVAGLLLFSDSPSSAMPRKCGAKITRYETREEEPEREHLKEQFTVEGPLFSLIHCTVNTVSEIMSSVKIWTVEGIKSVDYPPEAIWEIVVNAIIHRDYSISDDVQIHIYNNRIEVISPGRLPGYVTVDNILDARYSRNHKIVRTLNRYKNPPNKDMGEGLNTAFQKMKEWKLKNPEILEEGNYVKVIIPHTPIAQPEELILNFLEKNKMIRNRQARDISGIRSENVMKNVFYKLRDEGFIERVPGLEGSLAAWRMKKVE